jgi:hypothetical protein
VTAALIDHENNFANYVSRGSPASSASACAGLPDFSWRSVPGTDVVILKIFSPKNFAKRLAFFAQNKAKLCKNYIITLVFEKNANFFAENWQKSQKIVIITSTPERKKCSSNGNKIHQLA